MAKPPHGKPMQSKHHPPANRAPAEPAQALREEGVRLAADYWRAFAQLESVRRNLSALDRVLMADYPMTHAPTGLWIVQWVSPERLSAPDAMRMAGQACAHLGAVEDFMRDWRAWVAEMAGEAGTVAI